jgi:hypothetical protein
MKNSFNNNMQLSKMFIITITISKFQYSKITQHSHQLHSMSYIISFHKKISVFDLIFQFLNFYEKKIQF